MKKNKFIDNLLKDFNNYLSKYFPRKVCKKLVVESRSIFSYFITNNVEEVFLLVQKEQKSWQCKYRVIPSYYTCHEKFEFIEKDLSKDTKIFSIKDYYSNYVNKVKA